MYEFVGQNPGVVRGEVARCRSVSSSSLSVCFTGIFRGHEFVLKVPIAICTVCLSTIAAAAHGS